jgi:class 3 adenylate cyclase
MNLRELDRLLAAHLAETSSGLVEGPPSALRRGEGTERNFFILKVDLVGSTQLLMGRRLETYMRLAHTFLSTVDRITQEYGSDPNQVEYAGDGLMAYFPDRQDAATRVLECAYYVQAAVQRIALLGGTVGGLKPRCRMVVHHAPLVVARIGPRANSTLSAIGWPLHRVSKIEKDIDPGTGRATTEFAQQLPRELRRHLVGVYREEQVLVQPPTPVTFGFAPPANTLLGGYLSPPPPPDSWLADALYRRVTPPPPAPAPYYETKRTVVGYDINWKTLESVLS